MAIIQPNSEIYLIKSPIELDNDNQLSFASATAQANYFLSLPKQTLTNATFLRKDGYIRWPGSMENILNYNYCMYRNKNHGNKWFYAFITNMEYSNDQMTYVYIKTDVWQTWQFDITFRKCFVEREPVNDDTFGLHTVPEGLESGDFVINGNPIRESFTNVSNPGGGGTFIMFQVTTTTLTKGSNTYTFPSATMPVFNGIPQGCSVFAVPLTDAGLARMYSVCGVYDSYGRGDAIIAISLVPYNVCTWEVKPDSSNNS